MPGRRRLHEDIHRPIDLWAHSLEVAGDRMEKLEDLRLEVDARRRKIEGKLHKATRDFAYESRPQQGSVAEEGALQGGCQACVKATGVPAFRVFMRRNARCKLFLTSLPPGVGNLISG